MVNRIVASNAMAIDAAAVKAKALGYEVQSLGSANAGEAAEEGRRLMGRLLAIRAESAHTRQQPAPDQQRRVCILSGGEPTVNLSASGTRASGEPRSVAAARGGRNQELVLAAIASHRDAADWKNIVLLSGGTDGEDGPTDAAGAIADEAVIARITASGLDPGQLSCPARFVHIFRRRRWSVQNRPNSYQRHGPARWFAMSVAWKCMLHILRLRHHAFRP